MSPQPEPTAAIAVQDLQADRPWTSTASQPLLDDIAAADPGEDPMQGLIRHMICMILQPFAEHVRVLQTQAQHTHKDMGLMEERVSQNKAALEQHDRDILALRASGGQQSARLDKMHIELAKEHEEVMKVEHDLETTKVALGKTNERHQSMKKYVDGLEQSFEQLDEGVSTLKDAMAKMDKTFRGHLKNFTKLREAHDELISRSPGNNGDLDEVKHQLASLEREFQRFVKGHKQQTEDDTQILGGLNTHVASLHALLEDTRESLQKTAGDLRSTNGDIKTINSTLEYVHGQIKAMDEMQRAQQEMGHNLRKTTDLLSKTDAALEKLGDAFVQERQASGSLLQDLRSKAETHGESLGGLTKMHHRHGDLLKDTVWRTDKLHRDSKRLQEQVDVNETELHNLAAAHKAAASRLEAHTQDSGKAHADMQQTAKDFDASLSQVKGDLGATSSSLAKLATRFEACNSSLQGVGRGLQDVHRGIVAGENGLLAPKTARTLPAVNTLPALSARGPKTPPTRSGISSAWTTAEFGPRPGTRSLRDE